MMSMIKNIEILSLLMILVSNSLLIPGFLCGNKKKKKNENAIKFFARQTGTLTHAEKEIR